MFEDRFPRPFHVDKDSLTEVPAEQLVNWTSGVVEESLIQVSSSDIICVLSKKDYLIPILKRLLALSIMPNRSAHIHLGSLQSSNCRIAGECHFGVAGHSVLN